VRLPKDCTSFRDYRVEELIGQKLWKSIAPRTELECFLVGALAFNLAKLLVVQECIDGPNSNPPGIRLFRPILQQMIAVYGLASRAASRLQDRVPLEFSEGDALELASKVEEQIRALLGAADVGDAADPKTTAATAVTALVGTAGQADDGRQEEPLNEEYVRLQQECRKLKLDRPMVVEVLRGLVQPDFRMFFVLGEVLTDVGGNIGGRVFDELRKHYEPDPGAPPQPDIGCRRANRKLEASWVMSTVNVVLQLKGALSRRRRYARRSPHSGLRWPFVAGAWGMKCMAARVSHRT
jgi:hypothetical protein